jgi:catechol 2,3-dioxygenase-like lactoylglutathione lyase family enzyme
MPATKSKSKPDRSSSPKSNLPEARFHSIAVVVSDRRRALEWYTTRLGLDAIDQFDHWVTVGRKGHPGVIHLCQTSEYDTSLPPEKGNTGIQLRLPGDFEAACRALAENGVTFRVPATQEEWGWWASIEDPDGNEISLAPEG